MSRKDPTTQDSPPGFSAQNGVIERVYDPEDLDEIEECIACKEEYDTAPCYSCPTYDGDLEALVEKMDKDLLKRGEPMRISK